ncbi:sensor histidine kinase [Spongiimicrobium salis]|uniref:sensor histidine kinase n=1 Tax=Spongiimicrobium salis TaxID=1667022 RepID=UPI00374D95C2
MMGQDETPVYLGNAIDLINYPASQLYKGAEREFIADGLNVKGIYETVRQEKNLWHLSTTFTITQKMMEEEDVWLQFRSNIYAASVYLNDELLFKNGVLKSRSSALVPGKNLVQHRLPRKQLFPGKNTIIITFSNYKNQDATIIQDLAIGPLGSFHKNSLIMTFAPLLFSGIFLFALLINMGLYFALQRKKTFIVLALLFFVNSLLVLYEVGYWNGLVDATSLVHSHALRSILEYLVYFILLFVVYFEYGLSKKVLGYGILGFLFVYGLSYLLNLPQALVLSSVPCIFSIFFCRKDRFLIPAALGIVFLFNLIDDLNLIENFEFVNRHYMVTSIIYKLDNLGMIIFALMMIFSSAKSILAKTMALNEAKLRLNRLEYQFLQKRILPHFLVNSLMSLQQLISKEPDKASEMVEALSEEFHVLAAMGKKKLIPIQEEIEMCHNHLKIMSIQQRAHYYLTTKGILGHETIPPAIIHTLIENGITHGYSGNQDAHFELHKEEKEFGIQYRLVNDSKTGLASSKPGSGTGFKYIEARLEECYPGKWNLHSRKVPAGWEVIIEIHLKP